MNTKSWEEIQNDLDAMAKMPCRPDFKKLPKDFITDEDRSVKWNREQVELNNKKYQDEVSRLNTAKNKARDAANKEIYKKIQDEVGHGISEKAAMKIWDRAYSNSHAYGVMEVLNELDDLIDFVKSILDEV